MWLIKLGNHFIYFYVFLGTVESEELCNYMKVEQGKEATEQEVDMISLSSSSLSDFDVITDEEINKLK